MPVFAPKMIIRFSSLLALPGHLFPFFNPIYYNHRPKPKYILFQWVVSSTEAVRILVESQHLIRAQLQSIPMHHRWIPRPSCSPRIHRKVQKLPLDCHGDRIYRTTPRMHATNYRIRVQYCCDVHTHHSAVLHRVCNRPIGQWECQCVCVSFCNRFRNRLCLAK